MGELTTGVSWLGVVVGAVVSFLVGWLWFSPKLFGVKWAEGVGVELGAASEMPVGAMVFQVIGLLLVCWRNSRFKCTAYGDPWHSGIYRTRIFRRDV